MPYFPPRPFFPSSEDSIITIKLLLRSFLAGPQFRWEYKLVMHRHALLDMIQKWTSPSLLEQQNGLSKWLTNGVTVHKVADPDDGSVRLGAQSELVSTMLCCPRTCDSPTLPTSPTTATSPTSHISADSISSSTSAGSISSTSRYDILQVQWADWGPPISRWFHVNGNYTWLINQSAGQRCVFLDPNPRDESKWMIGVADFNLHNIRRKGNKGEDTNGSDSGNNGEEKKEEESEILDHQGVFSEEVYMGLKCVIYHAPGEHDFDAVMMDEERLLGLKCFAGPAWPESRGFGLASSGSGFEKFQARPRLPAPAWLWLGPA
ncbi:hypothetical protein JOM56_014940 [Amanita muscaria]